jgi:Tol biopolymer transport system component
MTDASGIAMVAWTLDTIAGQQLAEAGIAGTPPDTMMSVVSFSAAASPGPATRLALLVQPTTVFADHSFPRVLEVAALDRYGNTATDFRGTITLTLNPSGTLAGTISVAVANGVARFTDLRIPQAGTGYTLTASATPLPQVTTAAFDVITPGPGRLLFQSDRDGNSEIYSMNADGSGVVRLTNDPAYDAEPTWSPDGAKIAFASSRAGVSEIYTMTFDGSGVAALSDSSTSPAWSPDGRRLAGVRGTRRCSPGGCGTWFIRVFVMNADGSGRVLLTNGTTPAWAPDGRLAFAYGGDIYAMNADGTALTGLTNDAAYSDVAPAWSPDGTKIAFVRFSATATEVWTMNADGSGAVQLTHDQVLVGVLGGRPAWSPDGSKLAYASTRDGNWDIYVMNADGTGVTRLTDNPASDMWPAWSP